MSSVSVIPAFPSIAGIPSDVLVDHWYVLALGLAFFSLQCYWCTRFWLRMRRHKRQLAKLIDDLEDGGGREIEGYIKEIPWLKWVDENFPRDAAIPSTYTRDDVLRELDTRIASDGHYLLLQRAGLMAPLLGVIITVIGFMMLLPQRAALSEEMAIGDILYMVTPLVAGVGTGAALAFINQWLLHLASIGVERVRDAARTWFDAAIWRHVGLDVQAATVQAITAMQRMAKSVERSAARQQDNARALGESIAKIYESSDTFQQTYAAFGEELGELPQTLSELTAVATAAVDTLQSLVPVGEQAVRGLDVSVTAFSDAVENQFAEAARTHRTATETLEEAVGRINESTMQLKVGSGDLQETVNAHTHAFKTLNRSLQKQVLPAHESFLAAISKFNGQAEGLLERLDDMHAAVIASIDTMVSLAPEASQAAATFSASADAFQDAVQDKFAVAAQEHREHADRLVDALGRLRESADGLGESGATVGSLVALHAELGRQFQGVRESLTGAIEQLGHTAASLHQSFEDQVAPSHRAMNEAVAAFTDSASRLTDFIDRGIAPATERLAEMERTMNGLAEAVEAVRGFAEVRSDIEHLSRALAQAARVADAIAALPEQVRTVLEEVAKAHQEQTTANSKGGLSALWRGRRRSGNSA